MKKWLTVFLCAILFLTGCGGTGAGDGNTNLPPQNPPSTEEPDTPDYPEPPVPQGPTYSVVFDKAAYAVGVGAQIALSVTLTNAEGVTYTSSAPEIASVNTDGKVSGHALGSATITAKASAKKADKEELTATCTVSVNPAKYDALDGTEPQIKWLGRTFTAGGAVNCYNTASGFEVGFYGTEFTARIAAAGNKTPQICVLIDGETSPTARIVDLSREKATKEYVLAENLPEGEHTIRVHKLTEPYTTSMGIVSLETDGYLLNRPSDRAVKMEIYGDSITVGHKNMRTTEQEPDDSADKIQNGCMTYAWLAAENVKAELNVVARTGIGMYSAWGNPFVLKNNWDKTYLAENDFLATGAGNPEWDLEKYVPDIVLINVGTNDYWYQRNESLYKTELKAFCDKLIAAYGADTKIVLLGGMMINDNMSAMRSVAKQYAAGNVTVLQLPQSAANHPREADNRKAAAVLTNYLNKII